MAEGALLPPVLLRLMGDMTQLQATFARARSEASGLGGSFRQSGATMAAGMAKAGRSVALVGVGVAVASTKMAADFQSETMVLHTAAGETLKNLTTVREGILNIGTGTGTGIKNLVDGMYQIEKAGYRGRDGLKVLQAAAQGAKEENAQLSTVTNAMTSVMASYHLKASDSVRVMNGLKTAAGEGKMTMEEFAGSLSTVLPIASANKISFEQIGGALATLTQHGTSAREGTQELASTIRNLAAPNNVAIQTMQRFGLSSTDVSTKLGKRGLTGTLDLLTSTVLSKMGKSGTVLLSAFNNSKQAASNLKTMLDQMPSGVQKLASGLQNGSLSVKEYGKSIKGLPADQYAMGQQFATLYEKSHGFSDALKRGGPAAATYTDSIKRMTGGAIGLNTTLQLTGENTKGFKDRVDKVGESFSHSGRDVEGWKETAKQLNVQIAQIKLGAQKLAIEIGTKLIPVVSSVIGFFTRHKSAAVALAGVIAGVLALSVVAYAAKLVISAGKVVVGFGKMGVSAVKGAANIVRGFRSATVAADDASGMAGTFGGKLRKGFDATIGGAKRAGGAVKSFALAVGRVSAAAGRAAWTGLVSGIKSVGLAMKTAGLAAWNFTKSMAASALAGVRAAAAWVAQKVALVASAIAEKAAAVAQWALNVAMDANPIGLIVIALVALVAGLVYAYMHFTWFRNIVQTTMQAVGAVIGWLVGFVRSHWQLMLVLITGPVGLAVVGVIKYWSQIKNAVSSAVSWAVGFVKSHWQLLLGLLTGPIGLAVVLIVKYWSKITSGFSAAYRATVGVGRSLISWVAALPGRVIGALAALGGRLYSLGSSAWNRFKAANMAVASNVLAYVRGLPGRIRSALGSLGGLLTGAGRDLIRGLLSGISSMAGSVVSKVKGLASSAVSGFKSALGISSPSKVFRQLGIYVNEGLIDGLTGSTARVKAATRRVESLLTETRNRVADLKGTKGVSNKWVASHEATLKKLEAYARKEDKLMRGLAAKRDSVAAKLKTAQKKLADLQKSWSAEVKSVADGVMQGFSVVADAPQEGFALTAQDVVNKMRDQMAKATQFAAQLQALKKKGLSSDLIAQIAAAGVDQGGATAAALAGASASQIKQINSLQKTTKSAATSAGKAVADSMYGAGIKSAQGLVKGLQSQEKAIEKQMMKIAKSMQKAIKKALGIKSPSRVFAAIGAWIPQGLAQGVDGSASHATSAVDRLAASVTGTSFAGAGLAAAAGGRGGTVHHHYTFNIEGSVTTVDKLSKDVEAAFLRRGMRNPLTYTQYKR